MADQMFVLASGEYDDYRVHCVVEGGRDKAEQLAAKVNALHRFSSDNVRVEDLPVATTDVEPVVQVLHLRTIIDDDGSERESTEEIQARWPWEDEGLTGVAEVPAFWRWGHLGGNIDHGALQAWGTDHERVREVFETHRQELLRDELCGLRRIRHREGVR